MPPALYVDIDAKDAPEFNEWYNKEHLPELLSVPGILSAARYEAVKGGPQYLACYELESVAVMQTPAFTNRPRTPWGQKVSPSVIGNEFDTHCRGTDLPGRRGNAGAWHGAGAADWPCGLCGPFCCKHLTRRPRRTTEQHGAVQTTNRRRPSFNSRAWKLNSRPRRRPLMRR